MTWFCGAVQQAPFPPLTYQTLLSSQHTSCYTSRWDAVLPASLWRHSTSCFIYYIYIFIYIHIYSYCTLCLFLLFLHHVQMPKHTAYSVIVIIMYISAAWHLLLRWIHRENYNQCLGITFQCKVGLTNPSFVFKYWIFSHICACLPERGRCEKHNDSVWVRSYSINMEAWRLQHKLCEVSQRWQWVKHKRLEGHRERWKWRLVPMNITSLFFLKSPGSFIRGKW